MFNRMGRAGACALLTVVLGSVGMAQQQVVMMDQTPPSRAQVLRFLAAMGVPQSVENSLKNSQAKVKNSTIAAFRKQHPDADAETLKKLGQVFDSTPLFGFDSISEGVIGAYQKNLSAVDVQAGIDFYSSDSGKHLLEKLPLVMREANETSAQVVTQKLAEYSEELTRKLEGFREEYEKQHPKEKPATPEGAKSSSPAGTGGHLSQ